MCILVSDPNFILPMLQLTDLRLCHRPPLFAIFISIMTIWIIFFSNHTTTHFNLKFGFFTHNDRSSFVKFALTLRWMCKASFELMDNCRIPFNLLKIWIFFNHKGTTMHSNFIFVYLFLAERWIKWGFFGHFRNVSDRIAGKKKQSSLLTVISG